MVRVRAAASQQAVQGTSSERQHVPAHLDGKTVEVDQAQHAPRQTLARLQIVQQVGQRDLLLPVVLLGLLRRFTEVGIPLWAHRLVSQTSILTNVGPLARKTRTAWKRAARGATPRLPSRSHGMSPALDGARQ